MIEINSSLIIIADTLSNYEMYETWPLILSIIIGVCLSACCGFRIFTPFFILSVLGYFNIFELNEEVIWIASFPAMMALGVATVSEMLAYYIPWFDNLLGVISTPIAAIAGVVIGAVIMSDIDPYLQWAIAIIAGGGGSTAIHLSIESIRAMSTATTGGLANFLVSTFENFGAIFFSILAIIFPVITFFLLILCGFIFFMVIKMLRKKVIRKLRKKQVKTH
ncbi:DUF4126 domain-containing protein [Flavobacteriaceae bacterium]|nr:DUF4126 domain-containing protein [Flavobacteriaceae bacterium]